MLEWVLLTKNNLHQYRIFLFKISDGICFFSDEALSCTMIWCGYKQINTVSIRKRFSISASEMPLLDEYEPPPGNSSLSLSPPDLSTLFHLRPPSTRWVSEYIPMWQLCAAMMCWVRRWVELVDYKQIKCYQIN